MNQIRDWNTFYDTVKRLRETQRIYNRTKNRFDKLVLQDLEEQIDETIGIFS